MLTQHIKETLEQHLHTPVSEIFLTKPVNYPSECIVFHTHKNTIPKSGFIKISAFDRTNGLYQCFTTPEELETIDRLNMARNSSSLN